MPSNLKKNISFLKDKLSYLLIASLILLCGGCKEDPRKTETLKVVLSADYPPFEFYQDGKITGFEVELIEAIAQKFGKKIHVQDAPFESLIASINSHRAHLAISALSATDERRKTVAFSKPYHVSRSILVTFDEKLKEIKNVTLGVQMGSTYETYVCDLEKTEPTLKHVSLSKVPDLIQSLKTGRIQGIVLGVHEARQLVETMNVSDKKLYSVSLPNTLIEYAIALPKDSPFIDDINNIIDEFEKDGTLLKLQEKWFRN